MLVQEPRVKLKNGFTMIEKLHGGGEPGGLLDYLERGSSNSSNSDQKVLDYLDTEKNADRNEERQIYASSGEAISSREAKSVMRSFESEASQGIIYNPNGDFQLDKQQLHDMVGRLAQEQSKIAGEKLNYVYALHTTPGQPDLNHVHVIYAGSKNGIEKIKANVQKPSANWIKKRYEIESNIAGGISKNEESIQAKRLSRKNLSSTVKRDNFLYQHINKKTGDVSLFRIQKAMEHGKFQGNIDQKMKELGGRLNSLSRQGIAEKIDDYRYRIDLEKFEKLQQDNQKLSEKTFQAKLQKTERHLQQNRQQHIHLSMAGSSRGSTQKDDELEKFMRELDRSVQQQNQKIQLQKQTHQKDLSHEL